MESGNQEVSPFLCPKSYSSNNDKLEGGEGNCQFKSYD
jgi:hypothetical protein